MRHANDTLSIQVKMPSTTPYVGMGFGHTPGSKGWGFHSDFGASLGKFKVSGDMSLAMKLSRVV